MITIHNHLHKGTALLIVATCRMSEERRGTPYVTFTTAKRALTMAYLSHWTGGSWQRPGATEYRYRLTPALTPLQALVHRTRLRDYAEAVAS